MKHKLRCYITFEKDCDIYAHNRNSKNSGCFFSHNRRHSSCCGDYGGGVNPSSASENILDSSSSFSQSVLNTRAYSGTSSKIHVSNVMDVPGGNIFYKTDNPFYNNAPEVEITGSNFYIADGVSTPTLAADGNNTSTTSRIYCNKSVVGDMNYLDGTVTLTWRNIAYDKDMDSCDLSVTFSGWRFYSKTQSQTDFTILYYNFDTGIAMHDQCPFYVMGQVASPAIGIRCIADISFTKNKTGTPASGTFTTGFNDIDNQDVIEGTWESPWSEMMTLMSGFEDVYINQTCFLNIQDSNGGFAFYPTQNDSGTWDSGFSVSLQSRSRILFGTSNHSGTCPLLPFSPQTISLETDNSSNISPSFTQIAWKGNREYSFSAVEGYHISEVFIDGVSQGAISSYTFKNVTQPHSVKVVSVKDKSPLTYVIKGNDNVNRNGIYESPSDNDNRGYYEMGETIELTSIVPTRDAHTFLGWSTIPIDDIGYFDDNDASSFLNSTNHITSITMPEGGIEVYAVWQETYPKRIINGNFELYKEHLFGVVDPHCASYEFGKYISVSDGYFKTSTYRCPTLWQVTNYSRKHFGWNTDNISDAHPSGSTNGFAIGKDTSVDNAFAHMNVGHYIYQDILTVPGTLYKWKIKHSTLDPAPTSIAVLIGKENGAERQDATRVAGNADNPEGHVGEIITTDTRKTLKHSMTVDSSNVYELIQDVSQSWCEYEGFYIVPDGQYVTRFTFESVNQISGAMASAANLIDDIDFSTSYPLTYDLGNGTSDQIYNDPSTNNYQGYYMEGETISIPDTSKVTPPTGFVFLGWSTDIGKCKYITSNDSRVDIDETLSTIIRNEYIMPASSSVLYAVYAESPNISIDISGSSENATISSPEIIMPQGTFLPTYEYIVNVNSGFIIEEVLFDSIPFENIQDMNNGSFKFVLPDVVGKHKLDVTIRDTRISMPETGQNGHVFIIRISIVVIIVALSSLCIRNRFIKHTKVGKT